MAESVMAQPGTEQAGQFVNGCARCTPISPQVRCHVCEPGCQHVESMAETETAAGKATDVGLTSRNLFWMVWDLSSLATMTARQIQ